MRALALFLWAVPFTVLAQYRGNIELAPPPQPVSMRIALPSGNSIGLRTLPLRSAVEHVPTSYERSQEHMPLRDAVEKRVSPYQQLTAPWWLPRDAPTLPGRSLVCFLESWAAYRRSPATFTADNIDPHACTHLVYAFAGVNPQNSVLVAKDEEYDVVKGGYRSVVGLKRQNPNLSVLLSVSGRMTSVAEDPENRRRFILSVVETLDNYGFDGLDLHWEYPGAQDLGGTPEDKDNFSLLVEELSSVLHARNKLLTASVSPSRFRLEDGYDVSRLCPHLDMVLLKGFDFNLDRKDGARHHAPLSASGSDPLAQYFNVDYAVRYWLKRGAQRQQLVLGVPTHARSFTLAEPNNWKVGAPIRSGGREAPFTQQPGLMAYYEVCEMQRDGQWRRYRDKMGAPFMVKGDQWVGYEDYRSIAKKMSYVQEMGLGGVMVWSLDLDDFRGVCGPPYPLLRAVRSSLNSVPIGAGPAVSSVSIDCDGEGYSDVPGDCSVYYRCQNHAKFMYICPSGMLYDQDLGLCNWPYLVRCTINQDTRRNEVIQRISYSKKDTEGKHKIVCYFTNWAGYRKGEGKFYPEHVDPSLCTHIIYAFASLDPNELTIKAFDPWTDIDNKFYSRITSLSSPGTKVLLALGGWTDSTGDKYSRVVSSGSARRALVSSIIAFLRRHHFQGLHLDWNYPVCWHSDCSKGPESDKNNFGKLVQELKEAFSKESPRLELAVAISGYKEIVDRAYDFKSLSENVDFLSLMSFDYHGAWEGVTGHISPLYSMEGEKFPNYNTDATLKNIVEKGADKSKLIVGVPLYGQTFTLKDVNNHDEGAKIIWPGDAGEYTQQPGMLAYYEICTRIKKRNWKEQKGTAGPYAYFGDQWVSYDSTQSLEEKVAYVKSNGYGGIMAWTLDMDDFTNRCCDGTFPLLRAINKALGRDIESPVSGCTKPPKPSTPAPVDMTMTPDTGVAGHPTTEHVHEHPTRPTTEHIHEHPTTKPPTTTTTTTTTTTVAPAESTPEEEEVGEYESSSVNYETSSIGSTTTSPWWVPSSTTEHIWWPPPSKPPASSTSKKPTTEQITSSTTTPSTTTEEEEEPEEEVPSVPEKEPTSSERPTPPPPGSVLPSTCNTGDYFPVPGNCNAYYRCILGEFRMQHCAGTLHWNNKLQVCDWPDQAMCSADSQAPQGPSVISTSTSTTSRPDEWWTHETTTRPPNWWTHHPPSQPTSEPTTTSKPASLTDCTTGQFYEKPGSCVHFYICVNGQLIERKCAPGLLFSKELGMCDWADSVQCSSQDKDDIRQEEIVEDKKEGCSRGEYLPHKTSCSKYLRCQWNTYQVLTCSPGLHWNQRAKVCDWPRTAGCTHKTDIDASDIGTTSSPAASSTEWTWKPNNEGQWTPSTKPPPTTTTEGEPYEHPLSGYYKVVCYFTNWAWYRQGIGKFLPEDINPDLCTHITYGFAVLDYENLIIKPHDSWADIDNKFYERVVAFKKKGIKVSLALGGWNDSEGDKYSRLVNNPEARKRFIEHATQFLKQYNFDGLDLDWEYPKCWQTNCDKGPDSDKVNFGRWVRELKNAFRKDGLLLSAAVSPSKTVMDAGYDIKTMNDCMDWIAVMTYDYHGQWDKKTGHVAPMYEHPDDDFYYFNTNFTIHYWISEGAHPRKLVLGMPLYGQSFTLTDPTKHDLNCAASGPGTAGEFTRAGGFLASYEICDRVQNSGWTVVQDEERRMGPYAYKENQWVSYDDKAMIKYKSEYIREMNLGGGMIWALDLDDFKNTCGGGNSPLLTTIANTLAQPPDGVDWHKPKPKPKPTKAPKPKPKPKPTKPPKGSTPPLPLKPSKIPSKPTTSTTEKLPYQEETTPMPTLTTTEEVVETVEEPTTTMKPKPTKKPKPKPKPKPTTEPPLMLDDTFKVVCYFTNWAWYRQGTGKYLPSDIDSDLCTHIVYGFAVLDGDQLVIKPHDTWADFDNKFYEKVTALKKKGVKVLLAIGGWNDSAGGKYSKLVNSPGSRQRFIEHVVKFILENNFDGLDLDWEYPKCWQVNCQMGPESDKEAFAAWVKELHAAFQPHGLLLSAAVSPSKTVIDAGYDVPVMSEMLDWIAVMAYDYHGQWDKRTGHVAPMYAHPEDDDVTFNTNFTIHYWTKQGADRRKLVLGMPMYGQSFSLADKMDNDLNAPTYGGGEAGEETRARGFLAYYEICERIQKKGWEVVKDPDGRIGPYARLGDQWVSFDDQAMIKHKSEYVYHNNLGGAMIWALDLDDFRNLCGCEKYPLLRTINRVLRKYPGPGPDCKLDSPATPQDIIKGTGCEGTESHASDCTRYYACVGGRRVEKICPSKLHFNVKEKTCDVPSKAGCHHKETDTNAVETLGGEQVLAPPSANEELVKPNKVVCYFTNWAWHRTGLGKYLPNNIDTQLCTHIVYAFAVLDPKNLIVRPHDEWTDLENDFYSQVTQLKTHGIKVMLGLGGWNDSEGDKYSRLVNDPSARARFVSHISSFLHKFNFDGVDLDWEYPTCWQVNCNAGPDSDKEGFSALVRELSRELKPNGMLISAAVSPSKVVVDKAYDVKTLSKHLDWIGLMAYDYHGFWDNRTGHVAPLYYNDGDVFPHFNTNYSVHYWLEAGAPKEKLVLGMPLYGQTFTLADAGDVRLGAPTVGPGEPGPHTGNAGAMAFYEICDRVISEQWTVERNPNGAMGAIAHRGNQWVGYDDVSDIRRKTDFIKDLGLGGAMVWALDLDDFNNHCGCGKNPLLTTINHNLRGLPDDDIAEDCT